MTSIMRYRIVLLGLLVVGLCALASSPARGAGGLPTAVTVEPKGQQGCAPGTVVAGQSKVVNGNFSGGNVGFTSELPYVGANTYPADFSGGGFSIITGDFSPGTPDYIFGRTFPGDPQRDVAASQTYFYSNPNKDINGQNIYHPDPVNDPGKDYATLWTQTSVSLTVGTTYNFFAYFDNLIDPSIGAYAADPKIELRVNGVPAGPPIVVTKSPDAWVSVQFSFTLDGAPSEIGTQTAVTLEIRDYANTTQGDDFAMTGINLKQCVSGLGIALTNLLPTSNGDGSYDIPFIVTLKNYGGDPLPLSQLQVTADLAGTFIPPQVQSFQVMSISSTSLTVNQAFNGDTDKNLLSGSDVLSSQATATITFTVRVRPGTGPGNIGPFNLQLQATAGAGDAGSVQVTDVSVPGLDPDPNHDQQVKDPSEDTPTPVYLVPFVNEIPFVAR